MWEVNEMSIIIKSKCIDTKCREENRQKAETRRQIDVISGLTKSKGPQRGDFKICREGDKLLREYREHKDSSDRKKIENEYRKMQREHRRI